MSQYTEYFKQAELAFAAYAKDLTPDSAFSRVTSLGSLSSLGSGLEKMYHDPSWVVRIEDPFFLFLIGI